MSTGLAHQLAGYGDVFAAEVDALTRETMMTTDQAVVAIDRNEHEQQNNPWRRVAALVGAAAIVIAAVAGMALLRSGSDTVAAPPYATAEDAAQATVKALNLGDWDAYRAAFADDATDALVSSGRAFGENEEVAEARFALLVAVGVHSQVESCTTLIAGASATCEHAASDSVVDALGAGPIVSELVYGVEDGLLAYVGSPAAREEPEVVVAFDEWLKETNNPSANSWGDYYMDPIGKDPSVVVAGLLDAVDEFLAQYDG